MNRFTISTRLMILIGLFSTLLIGIGSAGLYANSLTNVSFKSVYDDRLLPLAQLDAINALMLRNRLIISNTLLDPAPASIAKYTAELTRNLEKSDKEWQAYMATELTAKEAVLAGKFVAARDQFTAEGLLPAAAALKTSDLEGARRIVIERIHPLYDGVRDHGLALAQLQLDVAKGDYETVATRYGLVRDAFVVAIVVGVSCAALFGLALMRGLARSLGQAKACADAVSQGDLSQPIQIQGRDEVSQVLHSLADMQGNLTKVVGEVRLASAGVSTASAEIAQGNMDLSARTEQQASALEETAASMEELSSTVKQNADNADQARQLAESASGVAAKGSEAVGQVIATMKGINDSSRQIADIIEVIDGIAFQTNILALNAAVEAARAGEQGRGFAVVAGEVRSLASRSAEAAKQIKSLIQISVARVEQGTALVDQAGATMSEVLGSIRRVSDIMNDISAASNEQSQGVTQVGEAVMLMDHATQQNAALVEEMAAAAAGLKSQAQNLVGTVAVFTLSGGPMAGSRPAAAGAGAAGAPRARLAASAGNDDDWNIKVPRA